MKNSHELRVRVYYEDTDAMGIVYYANYLRYAERARMEMFRTVGFEYARILNETGISFPVVAMNIDYKVPARLDDLLTVKSTITRVGGASMEMQQDIYRDSVLLTEMKVTLVCIDGKFKAVRLPTEIREIFGS